MKKLLIILSFACCIMTAQAQNANLKKSVEDGIKTSIQQTENREWKEAFATCRALDGLIAVEEQKTKQASPELHYLVSKERLRMYMRLNNAEQSKLQIEKLEDYAEKAKQDEVSEDLLMTKAGYYQKFGMNDKSLQCYKELVQRRSSGKDEQGIDKCYQDMLAQAKQNKNTYLTHSLEKLYSNWQDSIKAVKAAQELKQLQDEYTLSQNMLRQKQNKIDGQQGGIILLCILVAALAGALLFFLGILFKNVRQIKKLKNSLVIANDNNELKSQFINNIGEQIIPSLNAIEKGHVQQHIKALKELMQHIKTYMTLESTREERYEMKDGIRTDSTTEIVYDRDGNYAYLLINIEYRGKRISCRTDYYHGKRNVMFFHEEKPQYKLLAEYIFENGNWVNHPHHATPVKYANHLLRIYRKKWKQKFLFWR